MVARRDAPSGEPPVSGAQACDGVLPGLLLAVAVGVAVGVALGEGDALRVGVGVDEAGADALGMADGVGDRRTVSGVQASAVTRVSVKSANSRRFRVIICSNSPV
jgi:hypothetical protein